MKTMKLNVHPELTGSIGGGSNNKAPKSMNFPARYQSSSPHLTLVWSPGKCDPQEVLFTKEQLDARINAALEKQRTYMAQELHDNVNQLLATGKLYLEMLSPELGREKYCFTKGRGIECISIAVEEIRKITREMIGPEQKEQGLVDKIHGILNDIQYATNMQTRFFLTGDPGTLTDEIQLTLLRILQEQVKNVVNYSHAKRISIDLAVGDREIQLQVRDNGIGFNTAVACPGIGLTNIRERVKAKQGRVELRSAPGKGCSLLVILPAITQKS